MNAIANNAINAINANTFSDNTEYMVHVNEDGVVIYTELDVIVLDL